jgi:hypothetical protein
MSEETKNNSNSNGTEKTKREFAYYGVTEKEHIEINTILGTLKEIAETEKGNLESLEEALESHKKAHEWLVLAEKNFKSESKKFYEEMRLKQLEATEQTIKQWEAEIKAVKARHDRTQDFIQDFEDNVAITKGYADDGHEVITFSYNAEFYKTVVAFAKIINLGGNFE